MLSLAVGALFLRRTNNYKRFLSYSTVENMGIAAIGLGIGGIGVWAAVFHVVCHTLIKSSLFLQIAVVRQVYGNYRINRIGDYIHINRVGAVGLLTGMVVLVAFPPSPLFLSELMILKQTIADGRWWLVTGIMLLLCLVIYFFCSRLLRLCYQPRQDELHRLGDRPRTVVVGAVAARRHHRAGALAARIFPGTDRPNRIAMNYYVTDNTGASVALNDIPEVSYAAFYEDLRVEPLRRTLPCGPLFRPPVGRPHAFLPAAARRRRAPRADHFARHGLLRRDGAPLAHGPAPADAPLRARASRNATASVSTACRGPSRCGSPPGVTTAAVRSRTTPSTRWRDARCTRSTSGRSTQASSNRGPSASSATASRSCTSKSRWATSTGTSRRPSKRPRTACGRRALPESVAGDSAVAHATAFARAVEKLARREIPAALECERAAALELERMAMQIADTGALCMDVGYQLGQVASEALRTMTINTTQAWCGNRFGKGLIRPLGTDHPLTAEKAAMIRANVREIARRYDQVRRDIKSSPSLLARFEQCGIVPRDEMQRIGGVGQAARASGLARDIRTSHPWGVFAGALRHESIVKTHGDVMARLMVRCREVLQSAGYIDRLLDLHGQECGNAGHPRSDYAAPLAPSSLAFGLVEGWRGETCHVLLTDAEGRIAAVRIKDPSLHNWLALALAVRGEGISDFPICNKSFNLSYCGHDL